MLYHFRVFRLRSPSCSSLVAAIGCVCETRVSLSTSKTLRHAAPRTAHTRDMADAAVIHRLVRARCALLLQAASKAATSDGSLTAVLQLDTKPAVGGGGAGGAPTRLIECEMSPSHLFTLLAVLEEAHAKLTSLRQAE